MIPGIILLTDIISPITTEVGTVHGIMAVGIIHGITEVGMDIILIMAVTGVGTDGLIIVTADGMAADIITGEAIITTDLIIPAMAVKVTLHPVAVHPAQAILTEAVLLVQTQTAGLPL